MNNIISSSLWDLPSPSSMSYFWNFGSLLGICFFFQFLTGLLMSFHYISFSDMSFSRVVHINRDVWFGWLIRFIHLNGSSVFFFFIYFHIARGIFFFRFVNGMLWITGVLILFILMGISFLGYVLPWGQMSYWAVAVITNLFSVVPIIGPELVVWLWGGFSVGVPTLTRFYSFHFLLPFLLLLLILFHLYFLHKNGSRINIGVNRNIDKLVFHPFFSLKDLISWIFLFGLSFLVIFFFPYMFGDPVNFSPADPLSTPLHIQPEWYFLFSYAILRSFPGKIAGVVALFFSVLILALFPFFRYSFSSKFRYLRYFFYWCFCSSFIFLIYLGSVPAEDPYLNVRKFFTFLYFFFLISINI